MFEQLAIYLWSISENLDNMLFGVGLIIATILTIIDIAIADTNNDDLPVKKISKNITIGFILCCLSFLIPSKQDLALIFTYPYIKQGAEKAVQSETAKKLHTISTKYLDKIINDLEDTND